MTFLALFYNCFVTASIICNISGTCLSPQIFTISCFLSIVLFLCTRGRIELSSFGKIFIEIEKGNRK